MESRVKKYYAESQEQAIEPSSHSTRSSRNARLYKHVYGKYGDLDNLPIEDNTNEIDMEKLRELVLNNNSKKEEREIKENLNILEQRKRRIDEQKLYDINKILEKAKYENNKLKEPISNITKPQRDILSTLQSTELSLEEIRKANEKYQEQPNEFYNKTKTPEEELAMTRELKYKNLELEQAPEPPTQNNANTNSLSFDLFEDLKPTGDTITTKPITSETVSTNLIKSDIHSGDTRDIDIIKNSPQTMSNDFFTNSYEFSQKDFADDDDFFDTPKKGGIFKIILLILAIFIFTGVIIYFVGTYGLGLS